MPDLPVVFRAMILITGATGLTGGELVRRLSAKGVPVRAMVRNRSKADALAALPHVDIAEGDMSQPGTLAEPLRGVDRAMLISSSEPTMQEIQTSFVTAAKKAGVKHVVKLSGIMPELDSPFRFARMHGEVERVLAESGLAYTNLRAGEFMHSYFRAVRTIVANGTLVLPMEDARIASIDVGDIAQAAEVVLTSPGHEGKTYRLTGPEALTMAEAAEKLSAATGKPIRYINVAPEDARKAQLAAGFSPYLADALFELFAERRRGKEAKVWPDLQTMLGVRPTTFDEFAKRHAAIFRGEQPPPKV
jgi:uncharacterized protein YbjT (DUF2867 family)